MKNISLTIYGSCFLIAGCTIGLAFGQRTSSPSVYLMDAQRLQEVRRSIRAGEKTFSEPLAKIEADAKKAMSQGPFSVTDKTQAPPSGDKHDYMSQAPYFWADP